MLNSFFEGLRNHISTIIPPPERAANYRKLNTVTTFFMPSADFLCVADFGFHWIPADMRSNFICKALRICKEN